MRATPLALDLRLPGEFNESNAAMALTALSYLGVDLHEALRRVNALSSVAGRFSFVAGADTRCGCCSRRTPRALPRCSATIERRWRGRVGGINARIADGHDPSWLYDVPFEVLRGHRVYCFGDRRLDLATRLDYAGVDYVVVRR